MDINPPNLNQIGPQQLGKEPAGDTATRFEGVAPGGLEAGGLETSKLSNQFSRSDLEDGSKLGQMVHGALQEMLGGDMTQRGLSQPAQETILSWMANDPTYRSLATEYLDKVLK